MGLYEEDQEAIMFLNWKSCAFLRQVQKKDWIALSCPDIRIKDGSAIQPIAMRLWLPCFPGLLDGWLKVEEKPKTLKIVTTKLQKGKPQQIGNKSLLTLPLSFAGNWNQTTANTEKREVDVI